MQDLSQWVCVRRQSGRSSHEGILTRPERFITCFLDESSISADYASLFVQECAISLVNMKQNQTLIIGSTGKIGRRIVQHFESIGQAVRHGSRQSSPAFDWEKPATWAPALEGMKAVYISFYPDLAVPEAPQAIETLTSIAKQAGVKKLVLLSGRGEQNAQLCEGIVKNCGLNYTLIRASWFSQNFSEGHLLGPVLGGVLALPAGNIQEPFVDADDIADIAFAALTDDRHNGELYEVTGPRLMTFHEVTDEINSASKRKVQYLPISFDDYRAAATAEVGADFANMLTDLMTEVLDGRNASIADGVQRALGRPARDFGDYCKNTAATGIWS